MNNRTISLFALGTSALVAGAGAFAQDVPPAPLLSPEVPPVVTEAQPRPDRVVYSGQLPSVAQLTQTAKAQGLTVASITQTTTEVAVTYRLQDNSTRTVSYQLLPTNDDGTAAVEPPPGHVAVAVTPAPAPVQVVEVAEPPPTVVYRYRYADPFYYDPFYWGPRAPVSVHLGFGFGGHRHYHHGHGHYRGRRW
jgi:hypothetical protein